MRKKNMLSILPLVALLIFVWVGSASAAYRQQCPPDNDGIDGDGDGITTNDHVCLQLGSGDGYVKTADGKDFYSFGFSTFPVSTGAPEALLYNPGGTDPNDLSTTAPSGPNPNPAYAGNPAMENGAPTATDGLMLAAMYPAPTIELKQGQEFFLTLHNVGMIVRPDLFDPHTVHYHGFPNVASIFDGLPDSAIAVNMSSSLTYYYNLAEPGTFMYHCHVEATEHMQMGMLGNLYVKPVQDGTDHVDATNGQTYSSFAYNDGDGRTGYDTNREFALQIHGLDPAFRTANEVVQPLDFAGMTDKYTMFNGRGYPDTVNPADIVNGENFPAQNMPALIEANAGDRVLVRISSLATERHYTVTSPMIPMRVVGQGAKILRGGGEPDGLDVSYVTNSVTLGGGEAKDVLLDTTGMSAGTYFIYSADLNNLSNDQEDFGGMMTEIVLSDPI